MRDTEQRFSLKWPMTPGEDPWIGVMAGDPKDIDYPFEIKLRYSGTRELVCAGLRIGEGSGIGAGHYPVHYIGSGGKVLHGDRRWREREKTNITRRMLCAIPLGEVLRYIEYRVLADPDPDIRKALDFIGLDVELVGPPEGRSVVPGPPRKDAFYIHAAELFLECGGGTGNNREAYRRLAKMTAYDESTVRRHVRRGWELRPDLKPEGVRTRRVTR